MLYLEKRTTMEDMEVITRIEIGDLDIKKSTFDRISKFCEENGYMSQDDLVSWLLDKEEKAIKNKE